MRRALAGSLLCLALMAHAQTPPATAPPAQAQPAAVPATQPPSSGNVPAATEAQPAEGGQQAAAPPPPQRTVPRLQAAKPPAPPAAPPQESPREAEVAALREEVNRLQSELDAARAAALPAPQEAGSGLPPAPGPWGWLAVTALLALAAGFVLGWRLLDRRIRRKYGGLRIY